MDRITEMITTIAVAIVGLGIASVILSKNSQAPQVIQAGGSAFSNALGVAEAPVTGASYQPNLSYPTGTDGGFGGAG